MYHARSCREPFFTLLPSRVIWLRKTNPAMSARNFEATSDSSTGNSPENFRRCPVVRERETSIFWTDLLRQPVFSKTLASLPAATIPARVCCPSIIMPSLLKATLADSKNQSSPCSSFLILLTIRGSIRRFVWMCVSSLIMLFRCFKMSIASAGVMLKTSTPNSLCLKPFPSEKPFLRWALTFLECCLTFSIVFFVSITAFSSAFDLSVVVVICFLVSSFSAFHFKKNNRIG